MAYIGVTLSVPLLVPQGGVILALPCLVGGGLSLIAVIALMGPTARQYFALWCGEVAEPNLARRPDDESSAPFWHLPPGVPVVC